MKANFVNKLSKKENDNRFFKQTAFKQDSQQTLILQLQNHP
jgi:hypothetical protein